MTFAFGQQDADQMPYWPACLLTVLMSPFAVFCDTSCLHDVIGDLSTQPVSVVQQPAVQLRLPPERRVTVVESRTTIESRMQ